MITIALCEDNEFQRSLMQDILEGYMKTRSVTYQMFSNGEDLLRYVKENGSFNIYILDVVMPGINGIEVAITLRQMCDNSFIIFSTSSLEYAALSYDVDAFYYLTKPIDPAKLCRVLDKACSKLNPTEDIIEIRTKSGNTQLKTKTIMYVELKDRAPFFYTHDGHIYEGLKLRGTFHEIVSPLLSDPAFKLCGVGLVVNMQYIDAMDSESLLLDNGTQLYFPRSAYMELKNAWKNFTK